MPGVLFDIRTNQRTGIARYGLGLVRELAVLAAAGEVPPLTVYVEPDRAAEAAEAVGRAPVAVVPAAEPDGFVRGSAALRRLLADQEFDLYHGTHYTVDLRCPVPFSYTVHDLHRLRHPGHDYPREDFVGRFGTGQWQAVLDDLAALADWDDGVGGPFRRYFTALNRALAARAAGRVAVSRATRDDMVALLGVPAADIDLVPCGVRTEVFHPRPGTRPVAGPYCLYVGLAGPNKRFGWLLDLWLRHADRFPAGARLVAVGGEAERRPEVAPLLAGSPAAGSVWFAGRVNDDPLAELYSGAAALLVASLHEGNHLVPLEALACGTEVICTDIPALRETLDGYAHFYRPDDTATLARLVDDALRGTLPRRAPGFPVPLWRESARALVGSLRRSAGTAACREPATLPDRA